jgi:hypothetical protein
MGEIYDTNLCTLFLAFTPARSDCRRAKGGRKSGSLTGRLKALVDEMRIYRQAVKP